MIGDIVVVIGVTIIVGIGEKFIMMQIIGIFTSISGRIVVIVVSVVVGGSIDGGGDVVGYLVVYFR